MSKAVTKDDALTPAQKQVLARTVEDAFRRKDWDGSMRKRPKLWNFAHQTAIALLRKGMVEEVTSGGYRTNFRLTKQGVEVGITESTRLLGKHPQILAREERKDKELNERNRHISRVVAPFRSFRVTVDKKKVSLGELLEKELQREVARRYGPTATLDLKQLEQLGQQIENLVP
jgi:hypothetical protein